MVKHLKIIFILILLTNLSCLKNDSPTSSNKIFKNKAVLKWMGDYAVDGCGFFVIINGHKYKPENESAIDDSFKTDHDIDILIEYKILNKKIDIWCSYLPEVTSIDGIEVISINRIN